MYKLRSIAQRGSVFGAAAALLAATLMPSATVLADALNPLTERSLLLSSSAPGWMDSDGSGNSETVPNANPNESGPFNYAPPGSGPNGRKTGETFTFRVSTDSRDLGVGNGTGKQIKAFTLQYCTTAAGLCQAPGNNTGDARDDSRGEDSLADRTSDLNVNMGVTDLAAVAGTDFKIFIEDTEINYDDWTMEATNKEDTDFNTGNSETSRLTGANNYITLKYTGSGDGLMPEAKDQVRIVFIASSTKYITNPGEGSFFVKMNTYEDAAAAEEDVIDGGVTVANVMTESIHITTKVLETMAFSVGVTNPDMVNHDDGDGWNEHGTCDVIGHGVDGTNRLSLGNQAAEYSLETGESYDVHSFWRLSSNSSGGATVYYSGTTLTNNVGDEIRSFPAVATGSIPGTEQFGLAITDNDLPGAGTSFANAIEQWLIANPEAAPEDNPYKNAHLTPLSATSEYGGGSGTITPGGTARFAFDKASLTNPVAIASNTALGADRGVLNCATAKMRYVANIGADTPAGVYTTKINYLAAPQY